MSPVQSYTRRHIIRSTYQSLYHPLCPNATFRFVLARPSLPHVPLIEAENATYGDLVVLDHLEENKQVANTVKTIEFFKWLAQVGREWTWVSKVDDDSFVNVQAFWQEFLLPRIKSRETSMVLMGRRCFNPLFPYPSGAFYTVSWDMTVKLAELHAISGITTEHEDLLNGRLLYEANVEHNFVGLDQRRFFDYNPEVDGEQGWEHKVFEGAICPHMLKDDAVYLNVASLFERDGTNRVG
ncbi:hypothetical protein SAICODRAFT_9933 [Saitoella complicata NRRL Y-17804]|nr:uncharacterized protein SAICODRAFT_9933 [Saitoella complicata NRRL Y-17804]ODQ50385.1 hypothetical protein SAICODRAFT_9933 [Saitoella complicata NRRL Y-17804]